VIERCASRAQGDVMNKALVSLAALGVLSVGTLGFSAPAMAAQTVSVGGGMGSASFNQCNDSQRIFQNPISHTATFTLPAGTWQPFMGTGTTWRVSGSGGSSSYAGWVEIDILQNMLFGGEITVSSFVRAIDTTGQFVDMPDDQDFGSFSSTGSLGGNSFTIKVTAVSECGMVGSTQAHMINTVLNLVSF
jgi:hypothetical protein